MEKLTRTKACRARCLACSENATDVRNCEFKDCDLYPFRLGKRPKGCQPAKAIKKYCTWCCGDSTYERQNCPSVDCPLYQYRNGGKEATEE